MDASATPRRPIKVLLEMRPALDKYAGTPQQTRLLFRGLPPVEDVSAEGLIQSTTNALQGGLPSHEVILPKWGASLTSELGVTT